MTHRGDPADRHDEGRDGADDRPRARIDEVVIVVLDLRRGHFGLSVSGAGGTRHVLVSKSNPGISETQRSPGSKFPLAPVRLARGQWLRRRIAHGVESI